MEPKLIKIAASDRWYVTWMDGRRSLRVSARTTDRTQAERVRKEIALSLTRTGSPATLEKMGSRAYAQFLYTRLRGTERRVVSARRACQITADYIQELLIKSRGVCSVSGIPLSFERPDPQMRNPWAPSLDRIDSALPYQRGNVRVVCAAANLAMQDWGFGVLLRLAEGVSTFRAKPAQTPADCACG